MGVTVQQLGQIMTAQEFGLHYTLECHEPTPAAPHADILAALANGSLRRSDERLWQAGDFMQGIWPDEDADPESIAVIKEPETVDQIMAAARAAGMVQ